MEEIELTFKAWVKVGGEVVTTTGNLGSGVITSKSSLLAVRNLLNEKMPSECALYSLVTYSRIMKVPIIKVNRSLIIDLCKYNIQLEAYDVDREEFSLLYCSPIDCKQIDDHGSIVRMQYFVSHNNLTLPLESELRMNFLM